MTQPPSFLLFRVWLPVDHRPRARKRAPWVLVEAENLDEAKRQHLTALRISQAFDRRHPRDVPAATRVDALRAAAPTQAIPQPNSTATSQETPRDALSSNGKTVGGVG